MDYEKKYKEALERARMYRDNAKAVEKYSAVARYENIFPELQESKDEKTRKQLINICNEWLGGGYSARPCLNDVRWLKNLLEKQKEPKHAPDDLQKSFEAGQTSIVDNPEQYGLCKKTEWSEEDERTQKEIIDFIKSFWASHKVKLLQVIKWVNYLEKQEPKPAEKPSKEECITKFKALCDAYDIKLPNREYDIYGLCEDLHKFFGDIQKPAEWNPEDEQNLNVCLSYIKDESLRSWLIDAIHVRYDKPARSEEDDATIKSAVHWLEKYLSTIRAKDVSSATQDGILTVKVTITNLKSFRPSWKPSEEQMKTLKDAIIYVESSESNFKGSGFLLESLFNNLQKL